MLSSIFGFITDKQLRLELGSLTREVGILKEEVRKADNESYDYMHDMIFLKIKHKKECGELEAKVSELTVKNKELLADLSFERRRRRLIEELHVREMWQQQADKAKE